jgi:hypothetical protein
MIVQAGLALVQQEQVGLHRHVAAGQGEGIPGVGLRQVRGELHALAVHRVAGLAELLAQALRPLAQQPESAGPDRGDRLLERVGVAVPQAVGDRPVGVAPVVLARIRERAAERDGVHAELVRQLHEVADPVHVEEPHVARKEVQGLVVELGAEPLRVVPVVEVLVAPDAAAVARLVPDDVAACFLHGRPEEREGQVRAGRGEVHLGDRVHGAERLVVGPSPAAAVVPLPVAEAPAPVAARHL